MAANKDIMSRLGVYFFPWGVDRPSIGSLIDAARMAESLGFDSFNLPWHYTLPTGGVFKRFGNRYVLDPAVVFPALAVSTARIRLGFHSAVLPTLTPFVWAQYFASLDVVSNGRLVVGAALGWWDEDFQAAGTTKGRRGKQTDEALATMRALWEGREVSKGTEWDLSGLAIDPKPMQGRLPVWIGGSNASIPRAVEHGDGLFVVHQRLGDLRQTRAEIDAASPNKHTDLIAMQYVYISDDPAVTEREAVPVLTARLNGVPLEVVEAGEQELTPIGDDVVWGTPEECARRLRMMFETGIDYAILDFQFHGLESVEFAKHHMRRFVDEVIPLV